MKSVLIIGMSKFGVILAEKMQAFGNEVMIVDREEEVINELSPMFTNAMIANCTNPAVIEKLSVGSFDICFVTVSGDFQSSLEITSLLKEYGAKVVVSVADRDIQKKFLLKNGADEVVYPIRDIAEKVAIRYNTKNIFDYIELTGEYAIFEIAVPHKWVGKSIVGINVRKTHNINILAIKKSSLLIPMPEASYVFEKQDHAIVMGRHDDVYMLLPNN
ncbi:MAG: TrkA family potassium uptake protein [Clostridiales bacterium]|jgi:trk system potassium uptake protein TrkA|nr:TrkA family potassium uptake protein [Clostridiales bacterium]HOK81754.1 TrkA family potassium uptake protein [Clostridia bacterium]HOL60784.1 TrkA family potassium uptake protein [Clostridia bacterium]HPO53480.1 TrkA family potassium uptake protein [Clostridia bacterium]